MTDIEPITRLVQVRGVISCMLILTRLFHTAVKVFHGSQFQQLVTGVASFASYLCTHDQSVMTPRLRIPTHTCFITETLNSPLNPEHDRTYSETSSQHRQLSRPIYRPCNYRGCRLRASSDCPENSQIVGQQHLCTHPSSFVCLSSRSMLFSCSLMAQDPDCAEGFDVD